MQAHPRDPQAQAAAGTADSRVLRVTETVEYIDRHIAAHIQGITHHPLVSERHVRRLLSSGAWPCTRTAPRPPGHHRARPAQAVDVPGAAQGLVMGADPTLSHNAHRQRELAEPLLQGARTMAEPAGGLGVSENNAEHILGRLRKNGLPMAIVEDLDPEARYRILYPKGRVCATPGCSTLLRRSNPSDH